MNEWDFKQFSKLSKNVGSTQIAAGNKGFGLGKAAVGVVLLGPVGLLGGMLGSKKVMVACLRCGEKWQQVKLDLN